MSNVEQYQEARTIYLNLCNAANRRDWKSVSDQTSRLGNLVMELSDDADASS